MNPDLRHGANRPKIVAIVPMQRRAIQILWELRDAFGSSHNVYIKRGYRSGATYCASYKPVLVVIDYQDEDSGYTPSELIRFLQDMEQPPKIILVSEGTVPEDELAKVNGMIGQVKRQALVNGVGPLLNLQPAAM